MTFPASPAEDWAPYPRLEDGVRAYVRDHDVALDALRGVLDFGDRPGVHPGAGGSTQTWGESLWQEVAVTDGQRLILWHGDDESDDDRPDALMFSSSVRTIPLRAVVDQGLRTRFRVEPDGSRTLHTVMLYLSTQTPERSMTELTEANETRTVQYVETYRFSSRSPTAGAGRCNGCCSSDGRSRTSRVWRGDCRRVGPVGQHHRAGHRRVGHHRIGHRVTSGQRRAVRAAPRRCARPGGPGAAVLREFSVGAITYTETWDDAELPPMGCGIVLVPWPNRVADGRWGLDGATQQLDLTEPSRGHASHGLLRNTAYRAAVGEPGGGDARRVVYPSTATPSAWTPR